MITPRDNIKKTIDIPNDTTKVGIKSKKFWGRRNIGEITPTVNQATDTLPKTSEILSSWGLDNFILDGTFLIYHKIC